MGGGIRATSQDRDAARAVGIDVRRVDVLVFGTATALAASAGSLLAPLTSLNPALGTSYMIRAIVVVIAGGLGNPVGVLVMGYGLGVVESLTALVLPVEFQLVVGLLAMLLVLVFRPTGLLGRRRRVELEA